MDFKVFHNSRMQSCRSPFGALRCGETAVLSVTISGNEAYLCDVYLRLWSNGREQIFNGLRFTSSDNVKFSFKITAPDVPQLIWYRFIIKANDDCFYYAASSGEGKLTTSPGEDYQITCYANDFNTPEWFRHGIIYQIFPDRFHKKLDSNDNTGYDCHISKGRKLRIHQDWNEAPCYLPDDGETDYAPNDYFGGNLKGITEKLSYLASLGISVIYLNPIFEAASNHRYNTSDYLTIDSILGTEYDFIELLNQAKKYGISIMLDGVFSHTGDDSMYFNRYNRYPCIGAYNSPDSPYYEWYDFREYPNKYRCWWNFPTLPEINELTPSYVEFICHVLEKWTNLGVDAWRLDVADELPDEFIELLNNKLKQLKPDAVLLGEVWEDASTKTWEKGLRKFVYGHELDGVMNYPFYDAVCDFLTNRIDADELAVLLLTQQEHYPEPFYRSCMNLLGSHDTQRLISVLGGAPPKDTLSRNEQAEFTLSSNQLTLGKRRQRLAAAIQYSMAQPPCIYYGDEAGLTGLSDPFNRKTYPWGHEDAEMIEFYRHMAQIRKDNLVFTDGGISFSGYMDDVFIIYRVIGVDSVLTIINRSNNIVDLELDCSYFCEGNHTSDIVFAKSYFDMLTPSMHYCVESGVLKIKLEAISFYILKSEV